MSPSKQQEVNRYLFNNPISDSRIHIQENYFEPENIYYELFNDIKHRNVIHNIQGSYWETMQAVERVNTHKYTKKELQLINQQIDSEFDMNQLSAMLA